MQTQSPVAAAAALPRIGQRLPDHGGIYAGIAKGEDGQPDHHLILLDDKPASTLNWKAAVAWGAKVGDGLPTRDESALLYAHLRDEFESGWHWTGTQDSSYGAWSQYFNNGGQVSYGKKFEARARAVRRLPLQSFNPSVLPGPAAGDGTTVLLEILAEIKGARADVQTIFLADTGAA